MTVQDRVDQGEDPEDTPMQETLQELFVDFFRTSGMPMSVKAVPAGAYDKSASHVVLWGCGLMALRSVIQGGHNGQTFHHNGGKLHRGSIGNDTCTLGC